MKVLKFGGTSVADGERIANVARLVTAGTAAPLVVVSALGGVTDLLLELSAAARGQDRVAVDGALSRLRAQHETALDTLRLRGEARERCQRQIASELLRLGDLSVGVSLLGGLSPRISDSIAAV